MDNQDILNSYKVVGLVAKLSVLSLYSPLEVQSSISDIHIFFNILHILCEKVVAGLINFSIPIK